MRVATGEREEYGHTDDGKNKAAVALGRRGGEARARAISKAKRHRIAVLAAKARWKAK
jgi:hypothetical protein